MTGTMRVPRSRGGFSGVLLVLLGLWGGLLPFTGPYFHFGFAPDDTWVYDTDRLELSIAPAAAAVLGGLIVLFSAHRAVAMLGAWLGVLGGAWFVVGGPLATLWDVQGVGAPLGTGNGRHLAEQLSGFAGLGTVIVFFAALALGRFAVVGVRETAPPDEPVRDGGTTQPLVFGRYARDTAGPERPGGPTAPAPRQPGDQRVAGEPGGLER
ncbi:hypothetical protein [Actinomadura verrucosospora]|uniref:Secreted protein n=1 Tax=Actinomadura verrucosospora TaxID=46165 RepID=A0A7D3W172_ACTVE|nr:hypothetical protein [Actinomadura verrucosospora]QKG26778.1 hypothetical protein ACTIVE_8431 [Actinomadura verrucosospora]